MGRKRCVSCGTLFRPDPRVKARQKTCGRKECQKARKRQQQKAWLKRNPSYFKNCYAKLKFWLEKHPGYLKQYRLDHPEYVEKDRIARRERRLRGKNNEARADMQAETTEKNIDFTLINDDLPVVSCADIQAKRALKFVVFDGNIPKLVPFADMQVEMDADRQTALSCLPR